MKIKLNKYKTKDFRINNHFILYDVYDNIISYYDNYCELSHIFNYDIRNLVKAYNKRAKENIINVVIDRKLYQLYTFTDKEIGYI